MRDAINVRPTHFNPLYVRCVRSDGELRLMLFADDRRCMGGDMVEQPLEVTPVDRHRSVQEVQLEDAAEEPWRDQVEILKCHPVPAREMQRQHHLGRGTLHPGPCRLRGGRVIGRGRDALRHAALSEPNGQWV